LLAADGVTVLYEGEFADVTDDGGGNPRFELAVTLDCSTTPFSAVKSRDTAMTPSLPIGTVLGIVTSILAATILAVVRRRSA
jgi:hypothetical protein